MRAGVNTFTPPREKLSLPVAVMEDIEDLEYEKLMAAKRAESAASTNAITTPPTWPITKGKPKAVGPIEGTGKKAIKVKKAKSAIKDVQKEISSVNAFKLGDKQNKQDEDKDGADLSPINSVKGLKGMKGLLDKQKVVPAPQVQVDESKDGKEVPVPSKIPKNKIPEGVVRPSIMSSTDNGGSDDSEDDSNESYEPDTREAQWVTESESASGSSASSSKTKMRKASFRGASNAVTSAVGR